MRVISEPHLGAPAANAGALLRSFSPWPVGLRQRDLIFLRPCQKCRAVDVLLYMALSPLGGGARTPVS